MVIWSPVEEMGHRDMVSHMPVKAKVLKPKESDIQAAILEWLLWNGVFAWRNYTGPILRGFGKTLCPNPAAGSPDIMGVLPGGRMLGIECKTPTGKLSPEQKHFLAHMEKNGAMVIVARSLDDVIGRLVSQ